MNEKKCLVVFYSRSGNTRRVAEAIAEELGADVEELVDAKKRNGLFGIVRSGKDAIFRRSTRINEPARDPAAYDLVIVGTPVWVGTVCSAVRTYLTRLKDGPQEVVFFATAIRLGAERACVHMGELCGKTPAAILPLLAKEVRGRNYLEKVSALAGKLAQAAPPDEDG